MARGSYEEEVEVAVGSRVVVVVVVDDMVERVGVTIGVCVQVRTTMLYYRHIKTCIGTTVRAATMDNAAFSGDVDKLNGSAHRPFFARGRPNTGVYDESHSTDT